jgi:FKBP-type peptidyl-prolyl cis-trans isomerase FklB
MRHISNSKYRKGEYMRAVGLLVIMIVLLAGTVFGADEVLLKDQKEKVSYMIGADIGSNLRKQSIDIDTDILIKGFKDSYSGGKTLMSDDEMKETASTFRQEMMKKQAEEQKKASEKNKKEGEAFLAENAKKEGVKTLPSGLQYKVITEGTGKSPKATDVVTVNYRGSLVNGTEFDSSYKRGQPATFPVNGVIAGWTEALQLMKEGAKWQLFIPSNLAYGEQCYRPQFHPDF